MALPVPLRTRGYSSESLESLLGFISARLAIAERIFEAAGYRFVPDASAATVFTGKEAELELEPQSAERVSRAVVNRDREPGLLLDQLPRPIERLVLGAEALRADPIVQMRIAARHSRRIPIANTISHRLTPFFALVASGATGESRVRRRVSRLMRCLVL
jgi:hypothetical protein